MMAQVGAICRPQIVLCVLELSTQAPQVHLAGEHAGLAELMIWVPPVLLAGVHAGLVQWLHWHKRDEESEW